MNQEERDGQNGRLKILERSPILKTLGGAALADLARQCNRVTFDRRATLHHQGDRGHHVYVVGSGRVRLLRVGRDERALTVDYRGPGALVGEDALVDGDFHTEARAAERVEAVLIPLRHFRVALVREPELTLALLESVLAERARCERRMEALLSRPVESRVADFLGEAVEAHGIADSRGYLIGVKYTHLEIASYVGSTRETVTLVLGDLKRRGIIEIDQRRVVVRQLDKLRALA
jgi:CRP/FNR family cyclic AMP-dependent transcriptional regulator